MDCTVFYPVPDGSLPLTCCFSVVTVTGGSTALKASKSAIAELQLDVARMLHA